MSQRQKQRADRWEQRWADRRASASGPKERLNVEFDRLRVALATIPAGHQRDAYMVAITQITSLANQVNDRRDQIAARERRELDRARKDAAQRRKENPS